MSIVVEDGTGLDTAEAYVSVAEADTYFTARGNADWTGSNTLKEQVIRKATEYLDATYVWIGSIKVDDQALGWPRDGAYDKDGRDLSDSVPVAVKRATFELAVKALSEDLLEDSSVDNYKKREKVDVLETEWFQGAPTGQEYNFVSRILNGLTSSAAGSSMVPLLRT